MTDISKLKAEAEVAHQFAVISIGAITTYGKAEDIADSLIRATIAQIALQAAEKEVEAANVRMAMQNIVLVDPAPIADDTWIKWEGGECPIEDDSIVLQVRYRNGKSDEDNNAWDWQWNHKGNGHDIIAYRIVTPAADRVSES